ncbi:Response regulator receiver domain-containing protein [Duganella sp. CF402]|uniref:response regulator n=1 Tax=unclassified Duganella TaxID=2636909 RepID=UPI0008B8748D|nr:MULTISPECIES: response regulator [unclassified Duganella]RZT08416.1 response regulator receiver domain-containing protein [Duganella sp. BK701]SEL94739.1 Response regulator receiver domain-containing protein [Duganella sp. CF402]
MRILLLDDDPFMLDILADMISGLGEHTVVRETDGRRALIELRLRPPQLVICDLSMPVMDGIDFLRLAAAQQYQGGVALLSGVDGAVLKTAARLAEAQGLAILDACAKPMSIDTLAALLQRAAAAIPSNLGK